MKRRDNGVTLIALVVTVVVLLIISGITLGTTVNKRGIIEESKEIVEEAQKESIIEKIEADLYNEKIKKGRELTKEELKIIIIEKGYASSANEDEFVTKEGNYTIMYDEIIGWK